MAKILGHDLTLQEDHDAIVAAIAAMKNDAVKDHDDLVVLRQIVERKTRLLRNWLIATSVATGAALIMCMRMI